jgi:uncharacterized protein
MVRSVGRGSRLSVRVTPRAKRSEVHGVREGALLVRLAAPPVDGKANEALCAFLAGLLGVRTSAIQVVAGDKSRAKIVEVEGLDSEKLCTALLCSL